MRNMARRLRRSGVSVSRITVSDVAYGETAPVSFLAWPDEFTEEVDYPRISAVRKSRLLQEDLDFSKARRILIETRKALISGEVEGYREWVDPWYRLLEAGAYAMPVELPEDNDVLAGAVAQFDDNTIEVTVRRFIASEQAWIALANMSFAFWQDSNAIRLIIIE